MTVLSTAHVALDEVRKFYDSEDGEKVCTMLWTELEC